MNHIGLAPANYAVPVSVPSAHKQHVNCVTVKVKRDAAFKSDNRKCFFRRRWQRPRAFGAPSSHSHADIIMGENGRAFLAKMFVPAGMITMPMRVDHIFRWRRTQLLYRRFDLHRERGELVIDQHRCIRAMADPDISARSKQHGYARSDLFGLDCDIVKITLGGSWNCKR